MEKGSSPEDNHYQLVRNFLLSIKPVPLIYRFLQNLEDALNVSLCGHFLIVLVAMCFTAFSAVTVQYKNVVCCYIII